MEVFCTLKHITSSPTMKNSFENTYAVYLLVDEVLHITYKKDCVIDLKAAELIVRDRVMYQNCIEMPILCDIRQLRRIDKESRDFLALEGSMWIKAIAFLTGPPVTKAISSFYLEIQTQKVPSRSFTKKSEALKFLLENGMSK